MRSALAFAAVTLLVWTGSASAQSDALLPDLEDEVMCVVCGTTIALSESPAAERQREFIRARIAEGLDKEEVKDALVAEYGSEVLASPDTSGFDLAAWVVPGLAVIIAAGALAVGLRRWRRRGDGGDEGAPGTDEAPHTGGNDPADEERLATDLGRYDL